MSNQVDKAFVQQFSDNLIRLAQQNGSKLNGTVMNKRVTGKYAHFDRLGATVASKKTSRHADTPLTDTPHSRRRVQLDDYEVADLIDSQDEVRMLIDPRSPYAANMADALGRTLDDIIIDAADGNATAVDESDSTSTVAIAHTIDEDFGATNADITLAKLIEARRILMANEIQPDEELTFALDAAAIGNLLNDTTLTSADYNTVRPLAGGELVTFMGFKFVQTERLNNNSEGFKNCLAFAKSGIGLATGSDITVKISERPDKSHATQVYAALTAGAVRVEEEKVVVVEAYRT